jgi:hypothetical protein
MVAEDARWAMDLVLSAQRLPEFSPYLALTLGHHFVRIAYEGAATLRSRIRMLASRDSPTCWTTPSPQSQNEGRHVTKLLDDDKKSYERVLDELDQVITEHRSTFTGNAAWWARWLESDLGLYVAEGRLLGASWPTAYRLGVSVETDGTIAGHDLQAVTEEWGGTLAVLGAAALDGIEPTPTLDLGGVPPIVGRDTRSDRYLRRRFEDQFPDALKVLLLAIEGEMNTLTTIVSHSEPGHELPVFRARTIALYHSLTALSRIADRYDFVKSKGMSALGILLADGAVEALLSSPGKVVRNRCMHYEIKDLRVAIDPSLPMFGIVESVFPGESWVSFNDKIMGVIDHVATLLRDWRPSASPTTIKGAAACGILRL